MVVYVDRCGLDAGRVSPVGCRWSRLHASSSPPVLGVEVHVGPREYAGATGFLLNETSPSALPSPPGGMRDSARRAEFVPGELVQTTAGKSTA